MLKPPSEALTRSLLICTNHEYNRVSLKKEPLYLSSDEYSDFVITGIEVVKEYTHKSYMCVCIYIYIHI